MLRVIELFAGIGAQASALERLNMDFESTVCEIDSHAYNGYCAMHGQTENLGDITKVEHLPDCDLLTYSPPCQDISIAGLKKGLEEGSGTRSSLWWEVLRLLKDARERERLPEVLVMENVDAIINRQNRPHLDRFIINLNRLGYTSSWQIMNAKDYGVAQNRRRFFMVSTLHKGEFVFPNKQLLTKRLKDYLESDVDESYYLTEEKLAKYRKHKEVQTEKGNGFGFRMLDPERERVAFSITTKPDRAISNFIIEHPKSDGQRESGLTEKRERGAGLIVAGDLNNPQWLEQHNRVYDPEGIAPTICTPHGSNISPKIIENGGRS